MPRNKRSNDHSSTVVGRTLRQVREAAGFTQQQAAAAAGMDRAYLSEVENGKRSLSLDRLFRLCTAMNVAAASAVASMEQELSADPEAGISKRKSRRSS